MFSRVFLGPLKKIPRDILPTPEPRSYLLVETKRRQKSVAALTTVSTHPPPFTLWWCCCPPGTDPQHRSRGQLDSSLPHTSHIIWSPWPYLLNISNHHPLLSSTSHSLRSSPLYISAVHLTISTNLQTGHLVFPPQGPQSDGSKPHMGSHQPLLGKHELDPHGQRIRFRRPSMTMRANVIWSRSPSGSNSTPLTERFSGTWWIQRLRHWRKGVKDNNSNHIQSTKCFL